MQQNKSYFKNKGILRNKQKQRNIVNNILQIIASGLLGLLIISYLLIIIGFLVLQYKMWHMLILVIFSLLVYFFRNI